ncbi:unnamed protein product [Musa acuminata subsp. malaccensis]|uniref:(wild Malaysian banana) hypothetical protein n=1 Tax=Musa acuminata subsp. malaccensis TaxID=214687 RepID=A0A804JW10_MUSAM|nr:unnamed protein product [Musa acuminata subsp. malaccensis]
MLQRAANNAYSWWWASHIRTKQSKWLDSNLQGQMVRVLVSSRTGMYRLYRAVHIEIKNPEF